MSPTPSSAKRIPPVQCLLTFEALARLRSVTQAADELFVRPCYGSRWRTGAMELWECHAFAQCLGQAAG
jgi:hypothetical protein